MPAIVHGEMAPLCWTVIPYNPTSREIMRTIHSAEIYNRVWVTGMKYGELLTCQSAQSGAAQSIIVPSCGDVLYRGQYMHVPPKQ